VKDLLLLLFALAGGLTLSGIAANLYRILAHKPVSRPETFVYYAVMAVAGPSVLFNNATKSFRSRDCSASAYFFATMLVAYWSFALGLVMIYLSVGLKSF
jgi:hypothetical protein